VLYSFGRFNAMPTQLALPLSAGPGWLPVARASPMHGPTWSYGQVGRRVGCNTFGCVANPLCLTYMEITLFLHLFFISNSTASQP